jgi:GTPase SAR1 family protein
MSYIVMVFGASGSGKTTLMEQLMLGGGQYSIHIKATNRPARQYDDIEIQCVESVSPAEYDYIYSTYGYSYGIQRTTSVRFICCLPTVRPALTVVSGDSGVSTI